jgi:hypothetical protein
VVAFQGVNTVSAATGLPTNSTLAQNAAITDAGILAGNVATTNSMRSAVDTFMGNVQTQVEQQTNLAFNAASVSVTGLSLGAGFAQLGAQYNDLFLPGAGYGSTGLPGQGSALSQALNFSNYSFSNDGVGQLYSGGNASGLLAPAMQNNQYLYGQAITLNPTTTNVLPTAISFANNTSDPTGETQVGGQLLLLAETALNHTTAIYGNYFGATPPANPPLAEDPITAALVSMELGGYNGETLASTTNTQDTTTITNNP